MRRHPMRRALSTAAILAAIGVVGAPARDARADDDSPGMKSPAVFGIGLFLSSMGTAGLAVGGYFFSTGQSACDAVVNAPLPTQDDVDACAGGVNRKVAGIVTMVTGGAFVVAGLPVLIAGALPGDSASSNQAKLSVRLGPGNASLRIDF